MHHNDIQVGSSLAYDVGNKRFKTAGNDFRCSSDRYPVSRLGHYGLVRRRVGQHWQLCYHSSQGHHPAHAEFRRLNRDIGLLCVFDPFIIST